MKAGRNQHSRAVLRLPQYWTQ